MTQQFKNQSRQITQGQTCFILAILIRFPACKAFNQTTFRWERKLEEEHKHIWQRKEAKGSQPESSVCDLARQAKSSTEKMPHVQGVWITWTEQDEASIPRALQTHSWEKIKSWLTQLFRKEIKPWLRAQQAGVLITIHYQVHGGRKSNLGCIHPNTPQHAVSHSTWLKTWAAELKSPLLKQWK